MLYVNIKVFPKRKKNYHRKCRFYFSKILLIWVLLSGRLRYCGYSVIDKMNRRYLMVEEANKALGLLLGGAQQIDVADWFDVSQRVISRLHYRFNETGFVMDRLSEDRPRLKMLGRTED